VTRADIDALWEILGRYATTDGWEDRRVAFNFQMVPTLLRDIEDAGLGHVWMEIPITSFRFGL